MDIRFKCGRQRFLGERRLGLGGARADRVWRLNEDVRWIQENSFTKMGIKSCQEHALERHLTETGMKPAVLRDLGRGEETGTSATGGVAAFLCNVRRRALAGDLG